MSEKTVHILIVDDEELNREYMSELLEDKGYRTDTAVNGLEALTKLKTHSFDLLVTDLNMPRLDGLGLLRRIREEGLNVTSILITAYGSIEAAVEALKLGACDFLEKPSGGGLGPRLQLAVEKALSRRNLVERNRSLEGALQPSADELIGNSAKMMQLREQCLRLAESGKTVLIRGATGTGKELVAQAIHRQGRRQSRPFVAINCAVLNRELLSSELFGHVKGAFSGAVGDRPGKFEAADSGTLFLDEIGEMDLELQARLLRVLETRQFERVGSNTAIRVDVRILSATNRNLEREIAEGRFREDLFHRLNTITIQTPSLREIPEDIPLLANHFLRRDPEARGFTFSPECLTRLKAYDWPGNIRELRHVVEQTVFYAEGSPIQPSAVLLPDNRSRRSADSDPIAVAIDDPAKTLSDLESETIAHRLSHFDGSKRKTAKSLGIAESTLYKKIKEYDLR
ncbi:MAG: sigma-54-dependent Fis family transcriptional regulator [bacterium]|nr:sigma-54-dependent Fis family transcriptional regulator [bacterium]